MSIRSERIDAAVCAAGELISALEDHGPINSKQATVLVMAAVRAAVPNAEEWEARASASRVLAEAQK